MLNIQNNLVRKLKVSLGVMVLASTIFIGSVPALAQESDVRVVATMSEVTQILSEVQIRILTGVNQDKSDLDSDEVMIPFSMHLDLNVIGVGKPVVLDVALMSDKIIQWANAGKSQREIIDAILEDYKNGRFSPATKTQKKSKKNDGVKTHFGGFVVGEFEYHQEPDGQVLPLIEINQARIYFSAQVQAPLSANNIYFLGEWNPVPEEVIHHIDELLIDDNGTEKKLGQPTREIEGLIPFERLYIKVNNLVDTGVNLTIGQFRNPFGIWSDYTSHRNFTTTKNNTLVNGFALKKIELGLMANKSFDLGFNHTQLELTGAIVHGRQGRTTPLDRADFDAAKDFVGRVTFETPQYTLGTSAYIGTGGRNLAFGGDFLFPSKYINISGEYAYQQNNDVNATFGTTFGSFNKASSHGGYLQFDFGFQDLFDPLGSEILSDLTHGLHLYGMYEGWGYFTGSKLLNSPAYKIFHGIRYQVNKNTRWTVLEYGLMLHEGFDKGFNHMSTQLEVNF